MIAIRVRIMQRVKTMERTVMCASVEMTTMGRCVRVSIQIWSSVFTYEVF